MNKAGDILKIASTLIEKIFIDGASSAVGGYIYKQFNEVCHAHYSLDHIQKIHFSTNLIAGLISTEQTHVPQTECNTMVNRCCANPSDRTDNLYCLPDFIATTSTAFNISKTFQIIPENDLEYFCEYGCNLGSNAVNSLMTLAGGYHD